MNEELAKKSAAALSKTDGEQRPSDEQAASTAINTEGLVVIGEMLGGIAGILLLTACCVPMCIVMDKYWMRHSWAEIFDCMCCCLCHCFEPYPTEELSARDSDLAAHEKPPGTTGPARESHAGGDEILVGTEHTGADAVESLIGEIRLSPEKAPADAATVLSDMRAGAPERGLHPSQSENPAAVASDTAAVAARHSEMTGPEIPIPTETRGGGAAPLNEARTHTPSVDFVSNEIDALGVTISDAMSRRPAETPAQLRDLRETAPARDEHRDEGAEISDALRFLDEPFQVEEAGAASPVRENASPERSTSLNDLREGIHMADTHSGFDADFAPARRAFDLSFSEHQAMNLRQSLAVRSAPYAEPHFTPEHDATRASIERASLKRSASCPNFVESRATPMLREFAMP